MLVVGGGRSRSARSRAARRRRRRHRRGTSTVDDDACVCPVAWEERPYRPGEVAGYRLVVAATDDPAVNEAVFDDGEPPGVWVNSADDPAHCSFTLPARVRRGDLLVTVSTGGHSPALASWLRRAARGRARTRVRDAPGRCSPRRASAVRAAGRSTEGLDWRAALDSGMLDLVREGRVAEAKERLQACLSSSSAEPPHRSARPARADDGRRRPPAQGAARPRVARQPLRGGGAVDLQPHRGLRRRRALPRRLPRRPRLPLRDSPSSRPRTSATTSTSTTTTPAVAHLFAVAAGLDSAVLGESEILGQVKVAWDRAREEGAAGPALNLLFRHAVEVGKRAPHRDRHRPRHHVGVAGRGGHGRRAARRAGRAHVSSCSAPATWARAWRWRWPRPASAEVLVANRTWASRGRAGRPGRRAGPCSCVDLPDRARPTSTCCSPRPAPRRSMLEHDDLEPVIAARPDRPLLIVDIAVPRDVDPAVGDARRRHAARHGRPAGVRRGRRRGPAAARSPRSRGSSTRRSSATSVPRSAREVAPLSSPLRERAEDVRDGRARPLPGPPRRPRRPPARRGRGPHPGHRRQAAARADGRGSRTRPAPPGASASPTPCETVRARSR